VEQVLRQTLVSSLLEQTALSRFVASTGLNSSLSSDYEQKTMKRFLRQRNRDNCNFFRICYLISSVAIGYSSEATSKTKEC